MPWAGNQKLKRLENTSPWFEIYELNTNTFALLEPHHCEEVISYLIIGYKRAALFDTGWGIANIKAEIEKASHISSIENLRLDLIFYILGDIDVSSQLIHIEVKPAKSNNP